MNAAYQKLCARLMMAGVPDARFDAAQLYTFVTGRDHRLDDGPTAEEASRLQVLAERRAGREPLQYLLGEWDFLDFTLKVGRGVLCPRADSEVVCETAIELLKDSEAPVVYDLCAGTGCLGLGIARAVPSAKVTCVELSHDAWPYLTANVAALGGKTTQAERGDVMNYYTQIEPESADLIHLQSALSDGPRDAEFNARDRQGAGHGAGRRRGRPGLLPRAGAPVLRCGAPRRLAGAGDRLRPGRGCAGAWQGCRLAGWHLPQGCRRQ